MTYTAFRKSALGSLTAALLTSTAFATASVAADAPAPAAPAASDFKIAFNIGVTSDYIFRGVSQNARHPAVQGGIDLTYGIFYAGVWASAVKFGDNSPVYPFKASAEVDLYAGIKPVWKSSFGDFNFDFGTIYYGYAGSADTYLDSAKKKQGLPALDYYEFKAGVNKDIWKDGNLASTIFFSPNSQYETGKVWTSETTFTQTFAAWGKVVPAFSSTIGYQKGDTTAYKNFISNGASSYVYGNAGVTVTYDEKISLDLRYWGTNIKNDNGSAGYSNGFCTAAVGQCGSRAMATLKFTY
jgi:uncharacterized protein (TIGR02001 family)